MKWTQALVVFGLAAILTFQVEQSSAATLRNAVASSEVDEALSVELVSDEHDLGDLVKDLAEKAKERLQKLREEIRSAIEKIKQQGVGAVAKDVAERLKLRLSQIREAAKKLAEAFGETELGKAAKQIAKQAEEAIAKIREGLKGKPTEPPKSSPNKPTGEEEEELLASDLQKLIQERIDKMREALRKEVDKIVNLPKIFVDRVRERLQKIRDAAKKIADKLGETELGTAAKKLVTDADAALNKIKDKIRGKPAEPTPSPNNEEVQFSIKGITGPQARFRDLAKFVQRDISLANKLDDSAKSKEIAEKIVARLTGMRDFATKFADAQSKPRADGLDKFAREIAQRADETIAKLKMRYNIKPATPTGEEEEELLIKGISGPEARLRDLAKFVQRDIFLANKLDDSAKSKEIAEKIVARLTGMRDFATTFADAQSKPRPDGLDKIAREIAQRADETIAKLKMRYNIKPATPTGEEELLTAIDDADLPSKKLLEEYQRDIREMIADIPKLSKEDLEFARALYKDIRDSVKNMPDRGAEINAAAKNLVKVADEAIRRFDEALKTKAGKGKSH